MKNPHDPRHLKREKLMQALFSWNFNHNLKASGISRIIKQHTKIDRNIKIAAPDWPLEQIAKIDLAILRLAVYEMVIVKKEPAKVIIDEAVELAKKYGTDKSSSFINGVLGFILKSKKHVT